MELLVMLGAIGIILVVFALVFHVAQGGSESEFEEEAEFYSPAAMARKCRYCFGVLESDEKGYHIKCAEIVKRQKALRA